MDGNWITKDYLSKMSFGEVKKIAFRHKFSVLTILALFLLSVLTLAEFHAQLVSVIATTWNLLQEFLDSPILKKDSSYTLGVAISSVAIIVAFIQFMSGKTEFRFRLRTRLRNMALGLVGGSLLFAFLGEFDVFNRPFLFQIISAVLMIGSISLYLYIITVPLRTITPKGVVALRHMLSSVVTNANASKLTLAHDIEGIFEDLLELSLFNNDAQKMFIEDFGSDELLRHFSESGYIFDTALDFLKNKVTPDHNINTEHIESFVTRLMVRSLENDNSFLNMFISEKIYPNMRFVLDEIMLKCHDPRTISAIFGESMWNKFRSLNKKSQLRYISLMSRYLNTLYWENNHVSFKPDGYTKNYEINTPLVYSFYRQIAHFFDSSRIDFEHKMKLLNSLHWIGHPYLYGVRTQDKPEELKGATGKFVYQILESFIAANNISDKNDYEVYSNFHHLYNDFLEVSDSLEDNVAYAEFTKRLKNKIIGTRLDDRRGEAWGFNYKGYFPEMILVYFYMFGYHLFSESKNEQQDTDLHLPIMTKLAEAFPRLHDGFKQEFYDVENLPQGKEDKLKNQGRKIIKQFLAKNMIYDRSENSLSYYYSGDIHSSKIYLNKVRDEQKIEVEKL
ncbi:MAG: hypothetical protein WDZ75_00485 [Candidatus Paceibacterota bacterium]